MNLSYWEINSWFNEVDFAVVGSGIVGLHTAIYLKEKYPKAKIIVLEKGSLPEGASTKNAGFACFGSLSEMLEDLKSHSPEEVVQLVRQRWEGLQLLRDLGDREIGYEQHGGYELVKTTASIAPYLDQYKEVNTLLKMVFSSAVFEVKKNVFGFSKIHDTILFNPFEGQIDTGKMMKRLLFKATERGISILNNCRVSDYVETRGGVKIQTNLYDFSCRKLCIATNGFAAQFIGEKVQPARAQVLITDRIDNLQIQGTFHLDRGFYYFRNINDRILLGGGRNIDVKGEQTVNFGLTQEIQAELERLLKEVILPGKKVSIAHRWSGIMGVGQQKKPIIKPLSSKVYCGVRLGGMGIAIGAKVAKEMVDLVNLD